MLILLAEDEEAMADAVTAYLSCYHMTVDWARNGTEALEAARLKAYDVMILDIMMPGMDGITLLRQLRKEGSDVPTLFLTAKASLRDMLATEKRQEDRNEEDRNEEDRNEEDWNEEAWNAENRNGEDRGNALSFFGYRPASRRYPSGFYDITIGSAGTIRESSRIDITEDVEESIREQVWTAVSAGTMEGKTGSYKYGARLNEDGSFRVILLDVSIQLTQIFNMIRSAVPVAGGLLLLLLLILLPVSDRLAGIFVRNAEEQQRFITDAGHDLKTPVAIMRANLDVLEMQQGRTKWSGNIRGQTERLELLVGKLLMMSRLDERQEGSRMEKQDLSDVLSEVWQDYQLPMQQKKLRGESEIQAGLNAKADREMIAQMVRLLMDNAVEYAAPEGEIILRAGAEGHRIRLTLENTVEKLPEVEAGRLTERFVRGNAARTQKTGGSGIGLAAVRRIAELHRGRLRVEYPEENRFRVCVELPKAA